MTFLKDAGAFHAKEEINVVLLFHSVRDRHSAMTIMPALLIYALTATAVIIQ